MLRGFVFALCLWMGPVWANPKILMIGDSALAWNAEDHAGVASVLETILDIPVALHAVSGAPFLGPDPQAIPNQVPPGDWDIIIVNGGANDMFDHCWDRARVMVLMDRLIAPYVGRGAIKQFAARTDAEIIFTSYLWPLESPSFNECARTLALFEARLATFADLTDGFHFVSLRGANPDQRTDFFDTDKMHPSPQGSAAMARVLADRLRGEGLLQ
ncbi:MAG: SGNH/GDSL hydrolase family protein [Pseudomonadota bacterium]